MIQISGSIYRRDIEMERMAKLEKERKGLITDIYILKLAGCISIIGSSTYLQCSHTGIGTLHFEGLSVFSWFCLNKDCQMPKFKTPHPETRILWLLSHVKFHTAKRLVIVRTHQKCYMMPFICISRLWNINFNDPACLVICDL